MSQREIGLKGIIRENKVAGIDKKKFRCDTSREVFDSRLSGGPFVVKMQMDR
jgi:hypothetical protein